MGLAHGAALYTRGPHRGRRAAAAWLDFRGYWHLIQARPKDRVGRPDIEALETAMERADRTEGFFVAFDYSADALTEIDRYFLKTGKVVVALTVREILDEEIAKKLA